MNYQLIVLTHGDHEGELAETLAAFAKNVRPWPSAAHLHADAPSRDPWRVLRMFPWPWDVSSTPAPVGFCQATWASWQRAIHVPYDHVFWLEHDFVIDQPIDLSKLAAVLEADLMLAQMALMRDAYSDEEHAAGGLFELRRADYRQHRGDVPRDGGRKPPALVHWLEHSAYWTSNPSLMRRDFMAANPFPSPAETPRECEGVYGIELRQRGYRFGVWGTGEPWCRHVGRRDGVGY